MEVDFTLWSLQDILKQIPFNTPVAENGIALDFSKINAPDYVKTNFKVIFIYDKTDNAPYDASCSIYSPNDTKKSALSLRSTKNMKRRWKNGLKIKIKNALNFAAGEENCIVTRSLISSP